MLGEGGPRADVLRCERVPHGGEEKTAAAEDHAMVEAEVNSIFGMVVVVLGRRHGCRLVGGSGGGGAGGSRVRSIDDR